MLGKVPDHTLLATTCTMDKALLVSRAHRECKYWRHPLKNSSPQRGKSCRSGNNGPARLGQNMKCAMWSWQLMRSCHPNIAKACCGKTDSRWCATDAGAVKRTGLVALARVNWVRVSGSTQGNGVKSRAPARHRPHVCRSCESFAGACPRDQATRKSPTADPTGFAGRRPGIAGPI